MTALAILGAIAFVWWFRSQWVRTERRFDRDLPLLMDHAHQWTSEPGSALDRCECGDSQLRRWTT
jgi:hypothetical protein